MRKPGSPSKYRAKVDNFDDQATTQGILSEHTMLVLTINVLGGLQAMSFRYYARSLDPPDLALVEII